MSNGLVRRNVLSKKRNFQKETNNNTFSETKTTKQLLKVKQQTSNLNQHHYNNNILSNIYSMKWQLSTTRKRYARHNLDNSTQEYNKKDREEI